MSQSFGLSQVNGAGQATNGSATVSIIAGQAGKTIRIVKGTVSVTTAAASGGGLVRICDGTTTIMQWDANAVAAYFFDFGPSGYPLTAGNAFQLLVSGAGGNQATANIACVGLVA